MSKHIHISERDSQALTRIRETGEVLTSPQPPDYSGRVVVKPWGYEFLVFQNNEVAIWFLHIGFEQATSMHCHPLKKTSLVLLDGKALCNTFLRRYYLNAIDGVTIDKGVFHSTKCLSEGGLSLIEIESPPNKTDLVRLSDEYGRAQNGYEGLSEMKEQHLERYGYFTFSIENEGGSSQLKQQRVSLHHVHLQISHYPSQSEFQSSFSPVLSDLYSICSGQIFDIEGSSVAEVGDSVDGEYLDSFKELLIHSPLTVLHISKKS